MLLTSREVTHVVQTTDHNCVAACLAMVTGMSIQWVENQLQEDGYKEPYCSEAYTRFLVQNDILPERIGYVMNGPILDDSVYLMICPSALGSKNAHMIVGVMNHGYMQVLDPNDDLTGEKIYSSVDYEDGNIPVFSYLLLQDCDRIRRDD